MAKQKPNPAGSVSVASIAVLGAVADTAVRVLTVPKGGTLVVIVDVGPMAVPYTVSYRGKTLLKSLVDRAEIVRVEPGDHVLAWSFAHTVKGWTHVIGASISEGDPVVLESKSEANKDQDSSVNFAIVRGEQ